RDRMSRDAAIARAADYFDGGGFKADLARRVAIPTESQNPDRTAELARYVEAEMQPALEALGFRCRVLRHGHGDVIRGLDAGWKPGLTPWQLVETEERYYGRGTADNKGQHTVNIA